jgi:hypothetical protein
VSVSLDKASLSVSDDETSSIIPAE